MTARLRYGDAVTEMLEAASEDGLYVTLVTAEPVTIPAGGTFSHRA